MSDPHVDLNSQSLEFVESLYESYLRDPKSVPDRWRDYFEEEERTTKGAKPASLLPSMPRYSLFAGPSVSAFAKSAGSNGNGHATPAKSEINVDVEEAPALLQDRVDQLIRNFRVRGHLVASTDPLGRHRPPLPELDPSYYGFTTNDLDVRFSTTTIDGPSVQTLAQILYRLANTYCRTIGAQFMHIDDTQVRHWLQDRMEGSENHIRLTRDTQVRILTRLTDAVIFEEFIQKKFVGAKSFSLEGGESLIPLLDLAIEKAGDQGIDEIVLGMAHRGRLNVLANVMGKSPGDIFREFEDADPHHNLGRGDVKYHLGYSTDWKTQSGRNVHLSLCFNPSHLEFVNPVALGRLRAKQDRYGDTKRERGMGLLIHGDAAFAGEGVTQETLNLSELPTYRTGGTLHVIVNNQIGFTTKPEDGRSSTYATDVAKMLQSPIFHVNGEDPEAVAQVVDLSLDFRKRFQRDVVIDMYCYRRRGHNEGDEPAFTQPVMYKQIDARKNVREGYLAYLLKLEGIAREEADAIAARRTAHLEEELATARQDKRRTAEGAGRIWGKYKGGPDAQAPDVDTTVPAEKLAALLETMARVPAGFTPHPKIERFLQSRREMAAGKRPLDWSAAEALAFASLASQGVGIRMTGQDCERGTFSHRHCVLHDVNDGAEHRVFEHLGDGQAGVDVRNSPLSETGVLGFEYGYSLDAPESLVLWEAQFGDFINCAQVIIDQFIVSAEDKWNRFSGITLLLPHGFEGQGPEHSSARPERLLAQVAEDNIQVVNATTPAQYFHCLRRQALRPWRKPLFILTPKSLLRHPAAVSPLSDLATGAFRRILGDARPASPSVRRVLLCNGKLYYELAKRRDDLKREDVAIIRIEQLAPLTDDHLAQALAGYATDVPVFWVQEEPENMGAWRTFYVTHGPRLLGRHPLKCVSRPASASPATGSGSSHKLEQETILREAFDGLNS